MNWAQIGPEKAEKAVFSSGESTYVFDASLVELLERGLAQKVVDASSALEAGAEARAPIADEEYAVPLRPAKILCIGLNYTDHAAEVGKELPKYPAVFAKFPNTLIGPRDDIELPAPELSTRSDWEVELAIVMGERVRSVSEEDAAAAIFGYTVANDVSIRDWQGRTEEWFQGKNWDRTNPLGPVVPAAELDIDAGLTLRCTVDGEVRQNGSTADMVFKPAQIVTYLSQFMTLEPGDLILTGTPLGVGISWHPRRWLAPGQVVETEIEGIGKLVNSCI